MHLDDVYQKAFTKSLLAGKTNEAVQWLYIAATKDVYRNRKY